MPRIGQEKVLLIGDPRREVHAAVLSALPAASVTSVADYFEGVAELASGSYTAVLASAEPVERRPEAAVRTLRDLCGDGRLILFGQPSLEGLSRKMLAFGADDYLVTPPSPGEIQQLFGQPVLRVAPATRSVDLDAGDVAVTPAPGATESLQGLPLAEVMLEALSQYPGDAPTAAARRLSELLGPTMRLAYQPAARKGTAAPNVPDGILLLSHQVRAGASDVGMLHLLLGADEDAHAARHFLAQLSGLFGRLAALSTRHTKLLNLALTDQLTGVANRRRFEDFLNKSIHDALDHRRTVTLLLFDIDDFKRYNDSYGHAVGDQILRETAALMRRCCREHDLVARIGGDEFAVVFVEKEPPRLPKDAAPARPPASTRPPQEPEQIFERFKRLMASQDFPGLGPTGKGVLTISGGMASFPWQGRDAAELIRAADYGLMQKAKKGGKNSLYLVGDNDPTDQEGTP